MAGKNDTRSKIMKVSLRLFSEQGYYQTTTKQIAEEAGINELTIFRHFKTKSNLFQETMENYVQEVHLDDIIKELEGNSFEQNIMSLSKTFYELCQANEKLYKVQMKLADSEKEIVRLKLSREFYKVLNVYFKGLADKEIVKGEPALMSMTLVNGILGAFTIYVLTDNTFAEIEMDKIVEEHAKQFIALYKNK